MTLLRISLEANLCPNIIRKGKNIILLEIQIRFPSSNKYVVGNEFFLAQQFGIKFTKKLFPEAFILKDNFFMWEKSPSLNIFVLFLTLVLKNLKFNSTLMSLEKMNGALNKISWNILTKKLSNC